MLSEAIIVELRQLEARSLSLASEFKSVLDGRSEIRTRAEALRSSHTNSWFGDHALTHYRDFDAPPRGFDVEWGHLIGYAGRKHNSNWIIYGLEPLLEYVYADSCYDAVEEQNRNLELAGAELRDRALDLFAVIEDRNTGSLSKIASEIRLIISSTWERSTANAYVSQAVVAP